MAVVDPADPNYIVLPRGGKALRCKATSKGTRERCSNPAARGTKVCRTHGAGTRNRVKAGTKKDPILPNATKHAAESGKMSDELTDELAKTDPRFAERLRHYRDQPETLLSHHELMARLWALADCLSERVNVVALESGAELPPPLLAVLGQIRAGLETVGKLEGRIDESTHIEINVMQGYIDGVVDLFVEYVVPERVEEALGKLANLKVGGDRPKEITHGA